MWGVRTASNWARVKAFSPYDPLASPGIIIYEMAMDEFLSLSVLLVPKSSLGGVFGLLHPDESSEADVVVGSLVRRNVVGAEGVAARMDYPAQLKFEDRACPRLREVDRQPITESVL